MKTKLITIGCCMWSPIWIFSYTPIAPKILNDPNNIAIAITAVVVMLVGVGIMFMGICKKFE